MTVTRDTTASRRDVWDVLADGWSYASWVVGASRIRAVDPNWPAPGSRIRHSVGPWPFVIDDETVVQSCTPEYELVLRAKIWPVGEARITMRLNDIPKGCRIEMDEVAVGGPMALLPAPVQHAALAPRNRECLLRLASIAEHKVPSQVDRT